jgi:hypothetical protein
MPCICTGIGVAGFSISVVVETVVASVMEGMT